MNYEDWANQTTVHPVGILALVVLVAATLALPRRYAPVPLLLMACAIPSAQRIVILDIDWTYLRILVLMGWVSVLSRGQLRSFRWITLDKLVIALGVLTVLAATARTGSPQVLVRNLGQAFDGIGAYMLFRVWIRGWSDVELVVRTLALIGIPVALAMGAENRTGYNIFHVFGGVPEFTMERLGRLRAQGAFSHPITAGCFWASLVPLFAAQVVRRPSGPAWAAVGVSTALLCVFFSSSSTPIVAVLAALLGISFFRYRRHMRTIRWALLGGAVTLHLVMQAPIWHLISRIDAVGGSTGWHRYALIERSIQNFGEWFLLGIESTGHWGYGMRDVTNEYLVRGFRGGFLALCIFIAIIALGFQAAGRIWRRGRGNRVHVVFGWALGASLFSHTVVFIAVSYFGQIQLVWALLLAMLGSMMVWQPRRSPVPPRPAKARDAPARGSLGKGLVGSNRRAGAT